MTRHFPPDAGAPSYRLEHLASVLAEDHDVTVLAAQPNRYGNEPRAPRRERSGGITIRRVSSVQLTRGRGKLSRLVSEATGALVMAFAALRHLRKIDVAFVSVPPLSYALPGLVAKRLGRRRLVVDVRDLWLDWAEEAGVIRSRSLLRTARGFEGSVVKRADRVTVATKGFRDELTARYGLADREPVVIYNGLDSAVAPEQTAYERPAPGEPLHVVYAGNLGPSQNLMGIAEGLLNALDRWPNLTVTIVGDGSQSAELAGLSHERLHVRHHVERDELRSIYDHADALLLHLAAREVYEHTVPSKTFEYAALGRPILCGVRGEARDIASHHADCYMFEPDDGASLAAALDRLAEGADSDNASTPRSERAELMRDSRTEAWRAVFASLA